MNLNYIINTDALARNQEGAIVDHPVREKDPMTLYQGGEKRVTTVYATVRAGEKSIIIHFYGLDTSDNFRGLHIKVQIGSKESGLISVKSNFDTNFVPGLLQRFWSGGPFSFIKAIVEVEEKVAEKANHTPWLRTYLMEGGIGCALEPRLNYLGLFEKYRKLF